jgi:hypothetical protein
MDEHEKLFLLRGEHLVPFERFGLASFGALTIRPFCCTKHEHFICSVCVLQAGTPPKAVLAPSFLTRAIRVSGALIAVEGDDHDAGA